MSSLERDIQDAIYIIEETLPSFYNYIAPVYTKWIKSVITECKNAEDTVALLAFIVTFQKCVSHFINPAFSPMMILTILKETTSDISDKKIKELVNSLSFIIYNLVNN